MVHARSAGWLAIATVPGIPLGLPLLTGAPEATVKVVLAIVITTFSGFSLARRSPYILRDDRLAWMFGWGAGVLGGAYGMNEALLQD